MNIRHTILSASVALLLSGPGFANGPGDTPPKPEPEPPRVETPKEDGDSVMTPHQQRAWDICCPLPNGQTLLKIAGNSEALRPLATLQCEAVVQLRAVCTERQQALPRKGD